MICPSRDPITGCIFRTALPPWFIRTSRTPIHLKQLPYIYTYTLNLPFTLKSLNRLVKWWGNWWISILETHGLPPIYTFLVRNNWKRSFIQRPLKNDRGVDAHTTGIARYIFVFEFVEVWHSFGKHVCGGVVGHDASNLSCCSDPLKIEFELIHKGTSVP